jgi:Protein of unknown function (DUF1326)
MRITSFLTLLILLFSPALKASGSRPAHDSASVGAASKKTPTPWQISGDLSEACTCTVPCTCNFGEGASPHHYCYSLFSISIRKGHYGSVVLDGLHLAGAHGKKGGVWYIDDRATSEQAQALRAIASQMKSRNPTYFETARILQEVGEKGNHLEIGDKGGFAADYIMGLDKKTPVVVENNTSWNIPKSIKGKTKRLHYKDQYGNKFDLKATNSNQGAFDWTQDTKPIP